MAEVTIVWHEPAYRHTFQSLRGPVGRNFAMRCERLAVLAAASAGLGLGEVYPPGRLKAAIGTFYYNGIGGDLHAHVGANPAGGVEGYAIWHHEGTKPHVILARRAPMLVFPNRKTGFGKIVTPRVSHPGNRPYKYITKHVREVF